MDFNAEYTNVQYGQPSTSFWDRKFKFSIPTIGLGLTAVVALSVCISHQILAPLQPNSTPKFNMAMSDGDQVSRRAALASTTALMTPGIANAAAGESPKFSLFGVVGSKNSMSEGAAYGTDQSQQVYSPYSPYSPASEKSLYKAGTSSYVDKKKAVLTETGNRLQKIPAYIEKKQWSEIKNELTRFLYETRAAARYLAKDDESKNKAAKDFFVSIEKLTLAATLKNQDDAFAAHKEAVARFDALTKALN